MSCSCQEDHERDEFFPCDDHGREMEARVRAKRLINMVCSDAAQAAMEALPLDAIDPRRLSNIESAVRDAIRPWLFEEDFR